MTSASTSDGLCVSFIFKPVGNAPILRKNKYEFKLGVERNQPFRILEAFLLDLLYPSVVDRPRENLCLYIHSAFMPGPDQELLNLFKCFGVDGSLVIHYSVGPAWR